MNPIFPAEAEVLELDPSLPAAYIEFLRDQVPDLRLDGKEIVVDCANGAASAIAPPLLAYFGGNILLTHVSPDGRNINDHCGACIPRSSPRKLWRDKLTLA